MTTRAPHDDAAARALWEAYLAAHPHVAADPGQELVVDHFGDSAELCDELLGLVLAGGKRATATLALEFAADGEPLPRIGGHWVACDGAGRPRAVLRTLELRLGAFGSVDEAFAADEGEDDGSLASWRENHERYWRRECERRGLVWDEHREIVLERFAVVWPPEVADGPSA